jgi:hypothetical protein
VNIIPYTLYLEPFKPNDKLIIILTNTLYTVMEENIMVSFTNESGFHTINYNQHILKDFELELRIVKEVSGHIILRSSEGFLAGSSFSEGKDELGSFCEQILTYLWKAENIVSKFHIRGYKDRTYSVIWAEIEYKGTGTVKLGSIKLMSFKNGSLVLGNSISDWVIFKNTIDKGGLITTHHFGNSEFDIKEATALGLEDGGILLSKDKESTTITSNYMTVIRSVSMKQSLLFGFLTVKSQFSSINFTCSNDEKKFIDLEAVCFFDNIPLNPGDTKCSEKLILDFDETFGAINRYSRLSGSLNKGESFINYSPPSGWCSWYFFYESVTEKNILDNLQFITENNIPVEYIQIDMGWEERLGDLYPNHKFPNGMKWLADKIHSCGKKAGIWVSPFWIEPRSEVHRDHPEWLLRDKDGKLIIFNCHVDGYVIDTSILEARQWITDSFRRIKEQWGYDYFKVDFLRSVAMDKNAVYKNPMTRAEALRLGMEAIRQGIGPDTFLLACGGHYGPTLGIANGNRTSNDIGADWETLKITFKKNILRYWMNENWWVNDPDCLLIRGPHEGVAGNQCFPNIRKHGCGSFNEIEVKTILTLFRATGGLMFAGDDFTQLRNDKIDLMKGFLTSTGKAAVPMDMFESRYPRILSSVQSNGSQEVAIVNWSDDQKNEYLTLRELIATSNSCNQYKVSEYWSGEKLGIFKVEDTLELKAIEPHGCRLLVIVPNE